MSNLAFVVLLPDARRQTVKVTSDTSLLQVLEDVCAKRGLSPNEWDLKHINREVDLGKSVRYSGLPNNATLEMIPSKKPRTESPVTIVLQITSGKRLSHQFLPSDNLWTVIEHWSSKESVLPNCTDEEVVCIYMRQEIMGQTKLAITTLKSLGLYHGSALIRLIHRSPSNAAPVQANVSSVLRKPPAPPTEQARTAERITGMTESPSGEVATNNSVTEKPAAVKPAVHSPGKSNNQSVSSSSPPLIGREPPMMSKNIPPAMEVETAVNVNASRPQQHPPAAQPVQASATVSQQQPTRLRPTTAELHAQRGDFHILGPNDALVYHADDVAQPEIETPPDDFYEVTARDVEAMYRSLRDTRMQLENAPLKIASSREEERDNYVQAMVESHPTTIVRVRFPDRFVLQGTFRTTDSFAVIYDFVRQYLRNNRQSFYLFTAPPKNVLSESSTLIEQNLIGYAVVYFGAPSTESPILKDTVQLSDPERVFHFTPNPGHLLPRSKRPLPANASAVASEDDQRPPEAGTSRGASGGSTSSAPTSNAGRAINSNVVPKWFKK